MAAGQTTAKKLPTFSDNFNNFSTPFPGRFSTKIVLLQFEGLENNGTVSQTFNNFSGGGDNLDSRLP